MLGLYDPDRSRTVLNHGEVKTWGTFLTAMQSIAGAQKALRGAGLRILSEPVSSPSVLDQIQTLLEAMPDARWHQWDPVFGAWQGGAPAQTPVYHFDRAQVIVSLDADFLGFGPGAVRYSKDFSSRRRLSTPQDEINRLYVVEPVTTITGGKADHRLALKAREVGAFVVLDVFQSVGTVPLQLREWGVHAAVGGALKFLCGGPGNCFLYVDPDERGRLSPKPVHT